MALVSLAATPEREKCHPAVIESHIAPMYDFTPERCVQAFSQALEECRALSPALRAARVRFPS
jgi:hypothetical protein